MMLYIICLHYSWFTHQLKRHEAHLDRHDGTWSSAPGPPGCPHAAGRSCLRRQGVRGSAAFPCKPPG